MTAKSIAWFVMTLLALGVALYAASVVFVPDGRSPVVLSLIERLPLAALVHFTGGAIALAVGPFQFSARLRARALPVHRWSGRIYVISILASGVAGLTLAVNSTAGGWARWGFGLLAVAWLATTTVGYLRVRGGNVTGHRRWMIRSYALTLAAVTLRLYMPRAMVMDWPMEIAYPAIAWLCWVPNLFVAEWIVRSSARPVPRSALAERSAA